MLTSYNVSFQIPVFIELLHGEERAVVHRGAVRPSRINEDHPRVGELIDIERRGSTCFLLSGTD